jgi:hypothetical protein
MPFIILWFLSLFGGWKVVKQAPGMAEYGSIFGDFSVDGSFILEENRFTGKRRAWFERIDGVRERLSVTYVERGLGIR